MSGQELWNDPEDQLVVTQEEAQNRHKRIARKEVPLQQGLREFRQSLNKSGLGFDSWAKDSAKQTSGQAEKLLQSIPREIEEKKEIKMQKIFKTDRHDSLKSVVQFVEYQESSNRFIYGGYDKTLKLAQVDNSNDRYQLLESIHFEGLPLQQCYFTNQEEKVLQIFKDKNFVQIFDLQKKTKKPIYNLFTLKWNIEMSCISPDKKKSILTNRNQLVLFDLQSHIKIQDHLMQSNIQQVTFKNDQTILVAGENFQLDEFDLRKGLLTPVKRIRQDACQIAANRDYIAIGKSQGYLTLLNDYQEVKTYQNLVTKISSIQMNDRVLCYASKWKSNQIRIIDLKTHQVLKTWPNVKTKVDLVSSMHLGKDRLFLGDEKGQVCCYLINQQ